MATEQKRQFQRADTAANWTAANPVLEDAEIGLESDTGKWKMGNGATAWNSLAYSGQRLSADVMDFLNDANYAAMRASLGISTFGASLIDDADAAAARATLGLGSAATSAASAFAGAARRTGLQYPVALASGVYTCQMVNAIAPTTGAMAANRLDLVPFVPCIDLVIDQMGIEVTTGVASSNARVGIWADSSGVPGSLLVGGTTSLDCSTTGYKPETVSLTMTAGTAYWLGVHCNSTQTFRVCPTAGAPIFGTAAGGATAGFTSWRGTPTYGSSLPSPPTSMTRTGGAIVPVIYLRVA